MSVQFYCDHNINADLIYLFYSLDSPDLPVHEEGEKSSFSSVRAKIGQSDVKKIWQRCGGGGVGCAGLSNTFHPDFGGGQRFEREVALLLTTALADPPSQTLSSGPGQKKALTAVLQCVRQ